MKLIYSSEGMERLATKMDEALLDEQRKAEALEAAVEEVRGRMFLHIMR